MLIVHRTNNEFTINNLRDPCNATVSEHLGLIERTMPEQSIKLGRTFGIVSVEKTPNMVRRFFRLHVSSNERSFE